MDWVDAFSDEDVIEKAEEDRIVQYLSSLV
jgi:hypothetical protein